MANEQPSTLEPEASDLLGQSVARAIQKAVDMRERIARERVQARRAYGEIQRLPRLEAQMERVRRRPSLRSWSLCEILFEESRQAGFRDPKRAQNLARLALEVAGRLAPERYGRRPLSDLLARGWALLANARRVASDLVDADKTFHMARFCLRHGTGDALVTAEVMSLEASLRRDQRRFDEAFALLDALTTIYHHADEPGLEGKAFLIKSTVLYEAGTGKIEEALAALERAQELIARIDDDRLELCCHHARIRLVNQSGRAAEALTQFDRIRPRYAKLDEPSIRLRQRWLEGEILEGLGRQTDAEACYREVRSGFIRLGVGYDAALASLNLAALYARQGRAAEMKGLAEEMLPIFQSRDVHREAYAALALFQKAARLETVTVETVRSIAGYLERARRNPRLRFEAPS